MNIIKKLAQRAIDKEWQKFKKTANYELLANIDFFKDLSKVAQTFILKRLIERRYTKSEVIIKKHNPGICLFILKQGKIEFYDPDKQNQDTQTVKKEGKVFGEIAVNDIFLTNKQTDFEFGNRTISVRAKKNNTALLAISVFDLKDLIERFPQDAKKLEKSLKKIEREYKN